MGQFIEPSDLAPFADIDTAKAEAMIEDAEAMAILTAPCLAGAEPDDPKAKAAKSVLRTAILRWNDAGSGAIQQVSAGPFQQSTQVQSRRAMFWPSEIEHLRNLCKDGDTGKAFAIDTVTAAGSPHLPWCSLMFEATYCSCGVDIAGRPIYENAPGL